MHGIRRYIWEISTTEVWLCWPPVRIGQNLNERTSQLDEVDSRSTHGFNACIRWATWAGTTTYWEWRFAQIMWPLCITWRQIDRIIVWMGVHSLEIYKISLIWLETCKSSCFDIARCIISSDSPPPEIFTKNHGWLDPNVSLYKTSSWIGIETNILPLEKKTQLSKIEDKFNPSQTKPQPTNESKNSLLILLSSLQSHMARLPSSKPVVLSPRS